MRQIHISIATASLFLFVLQIGEVALARSSGIKCDGGYQIVKGYGAISTPYCQDDNLSKVAQTYGISYSTAQIHHTPDIKHQVCAAIGHDNRVHSACDGFRSDGGDKFGK